MIYPDCDMNRWECCDNQVVLANADYYYTKGQVDKKLDEIDGMTEEEVQTMINRSIRTKADKTDVNALSGQVEDNTEAIENTYTKREVDNAITAATAPVNNTLTAHTADTSVHVTSQEKTYWNNKLDASAYTPTDLSNYYTKGQTDDLLDDKLDVTAYTPTDLSNYYTKQETQGVVNGAVSGKADTSAVTQVNDALTAHTTNTHMHVSSQDKYNWNNKVGVDELNAAVSGKADTSAVTQEVSSAVAPLFGAVEYDSQTQRINFKHDATGQTIAYVDATDFIKDGMVSNVEIINGNLVITFNSDAGKQPISIPLTDIFNPANYYTTAQTQSYVSGFTYDKATIDQKVAEGGTFDPDLYYDKTATDALLAAKADTATTYTKTEVNAALSGKADTSAVTAVANDVQSVSGQVATKVATSDFNTYTAATATAIDGKQDALEYYEENTEDGYAEILITNDDGEGSTGDNHINIGGGVAEIGIYNEYDDGQGNVTANNASIYADQIMVTLQAGVTENGDTTSTELMVDATGVTINGDAVATEPYVDAATSGKADTSAVTAVNDALTGHTADTTVHVTSAEKAEWNGAASDASDALTALGGLTLVSLTQAQYDALATKDASTIYFING